MQLNDEYKIGINLDVNKSALELLTRFNALLEKLSVNFDSVTNLLKKFNTALGATDENFSSLNDFMHRFGNSAVRSINQATVAVERLNLAIRSTGSGGGHREGFGGHLGRHLGREGFGTYGSLAAAAFSPEVMIGVGAAGFLGKSGFEHYSTYQQNIAALRLSGFSKGYGVNFAGMAATAAQTANISGVSTNAYLEAVREAAAVVRTPQAALALAPLLAKMTYANQTVYSDSGRQFTTNDQMNLLRTAELLAPNPTVPDISKYLNIIERFYGTEQGKVGSYNLYAFAKRDPAGIQTMSLRGLFELVPLLQKIGGSTLGAELRVAQSQLLRGQNFRTGKKAIARLQALGIMGKNNEIENQPLFNASVTDWVNQFLIPQLAKHGITSRGAIQAELRKDFGGRIPDLLYLSYTNRLAELESLRAGAHAGNIGQVYGQGQATNLGAAKNVGAAWSSFATAFGKLTSPIIIVGLEALTKLLTSLTILLSGSVWRRASQELGSFIYTKALKNINPIWLKNSEQNLNNVVHLSIDGEPLLTAVVNHANKHANSPLSTGNSIQTNFAFLNPALNTLGGGF